MATPESSAVGTPVITELVYLRGSPWSLPVLWGLHLAGATVDKYTEHIPGPGELFLRFRLGKLFSKDKVTVPVLLRGGSQPPLTDSMDIVKWAAESGSRGKSILPPGKEDDTATFVAHAQLLCRFGRAGTGAYGDGLGCKLLPWPLRSIPGLRSVIGWVISRWFSHKYSEDATKTSKTACEQSLAYLAERVSKGKEGAPLLGGTTYSYADLAVAVALEAYLPEVLGGITITALTPNLVSNLLRPMIEEHPSLIAWKRAVFKSLPDEIIPAATMAQYM